MPLATPKPSLNEKDARALAKQIAKDSKGVKIKFGSTNGRTTLHLISGKQSHTIYSRGEWEVHPENLRSNRPEPPKETS